MNPQDAQAFNQAIVNAQAGYRQQAYAQFAALHATNPSDVGLFLWMANTTNDLNDAERLINQAASIDPANSSVQSARQWLAGEKAKQVEPPPLPTFPTPQAPAQPMYAPWFQSSFPGEEVIYKDATIQVTNRRAVLGDQTYSLADITSIRILTIPPNRLVSSAAFAASILCSVLVYLNISDNFGIAIILLVIAIILLTFGLQWKNRSKYTYIIKLGIATEEVDGLVTPDRNQAEKVTQAINQVLTGSR